MLKFDNENERNYYINLCVQNNLSVRKLNDAIKETNHNKTIGIAVSKKNDKFILEYISDKDILLTTYKINSKN